MRSIIFLVCFFFATTTAAEYSSWAKPTQVSLVLSNGFRVLGNFGQPNSCEVQNQVFVHIDHPQYDHIYSMALSAVASQSEIRFEVRKCSVVGWVSFNSIAILDASTPGEVAVKN